jgi:hypothetical protein
MHGALLPQEIMFRYIGNIVVAVVVVVVTSVVVVMVVVVIEMD